MIAVTINGTPRTVDAPPDMPILWVLRDVLDLKCAKYGCGLGLCGDLPLTKHGMA